MNPVHVILRCPITRTSLRELETHEVDQLNRRISQRKLFHYDGTNVRNELTLGFISGDGCYAYPIQDGIIILLASLALVIKDQERSSSVIKSLRTEKGMVQDFYEQVGWQKSQTGEFCDTERFADRRSVLKKYQEKTALRLSKYLKPKGTYILDVASGPVHHPECLMGQENYSVRICVDLSFLALYEAQKRLGNKGIYLLADATDLPLKDNVTDAVVSLHTLYHIPADEQKKAVEEIHRVLQPGSNAVMVYSWGKDAKLMKISFFPLYLGRAIRKRIKKLPVLFTNRTNKTSRKEQMKSATEPRLYFHAHDYEFFKRGQWDFDFEIVVWNSISTRFTQTYVGEHFWGKLLLEIIYCLEKFFPHLLGKWGQYPLFVIRKK